MQKIVIDAKGVCTLALVVPNVNPFYQNWIRFFTNRWRDSMFYNPLMPPFQYMQTTYIESVRQYLKEVYGAKMEYDEETETITIEINDDMLTAFHMGEGFK